MVFYNFIWWFFYSKIMKCFCKLFYFKMCKFFLWLKKWLDYGVFYNIDEYKKWIFGIILILLKFKYLEFDSLNVVNFCRFVI